MCRPTIPHGIRPCTVKATRKQRSAAQHFPVGTLTHGRAPASAMLHHEYSMHHRSRWAAHPGAPFRRPAPGTERPLAGREHDPKRELNGDPCNAAKHRRWVMASKLFFKGAPDRGVQSAESQELCQLAPIDPHASYLIFAKGTVSREGNAGVGCEIRLDVFSMQQHLRTELMTMGLPGPGESVASPSAFVLFTAVTFPAKGGGGSGGSIFPSRRAILSARRHAGNGIAFFSNLQMFALLVDELVVLPFA